jgi:hypothetical protein
VIHEIHYAAPQKTVHEEFVELLNTGSSAADVSGWYFANGIDFTLPPGTSIGPGAHLVVAADLTAFRNRFGPVPAVGPFSGRLSNDGESLVLRNALGGLEDEVDYKRGFPWPVVGGSEGFSIELLHPSLDNDLGGSWRSSNPGIQEANQLVGAGEVWRYFKGTSEASAPATAWRQRSFNDAGWLQGRASIGYGEAFIATSLDDMRGGYSSVCLRRTFEVADPAAVASLVLEVQYDDGFNAWINGVHVTGGNVPSNEMAFNATASSALEEFDFERFPLPNPVGYLVAGTNVLSIQLFNSSLGSSSDAFIDARLVLSSSGAGPTPGAQNSVYMPNPPPQLRQVAHDPKGPRSGEGVRVTMKATDGDGVASMTLEYQVVDPGAYIEIDDPEYETNWVSVPMNDTGQGGDLVAGDDVFTALLPGSVQVRRRLVRYRVVAEDGAGNALRVPYPDDPQPNFAYFVYDGVPSWSGAIQPGSADPNRSRVVTVSAEVLASIPPYFLLTKRESTEDCTWLSRYGGDNYLWLGTLVAHGEVYDHIRYRTRGGVWRYSMGKNMWKFDFTRSHGFRALDDFGRLYEVAWDKLNFSAVIQQGDYLHRGEQGLFEAAGFKMFDLLGVPTPRTHFVQFRIVDEASEAGAGQYDGDFWGLYLAMEQPDGNLLDAHGLPDGNLYKMEGGTGELNNLGPDGPSDKSDLNAFINTYTGSTPSDDWWRQNLDLSGYYSYRAVVEGIHHYDIGDGKNYFYYRNPETRRWSVLPWDIDLTWANNMYGSGNEPFLSRVLTRAAFSVEYRNRMREVRDLLYNNDQAYQLLDELAAIIDDPAGRPSIIDADRMHWDYNPVMVNSSIVNLSKAGQGRFYGMAATRDFPGMVQVMKNYVVSRGQYIDTNILADAAIPSRPTVTYTGPGGFPVDRLTFRSSAFSDPQGAGTFAALKWRVGEVTPPGRPAFDPSEPRRFEIEPVWESGEVTPFAADVTVPPEVLGVGQRYRVRARMKDTSGRWSSWSLPVELTAGAPSAPFPQVESLRITEILYNPLGGADYEFVELTNVGGVPLDLRAVAFVSGIDFRFAGSAVEMLGPGEVVVVVKNARAFASRYGNSGILVAGEFDDRLNDGGELIVLTYGAGQTIHDFVYSDGWYPLTDGAGYSLVVVDSQAPASAWSERAQWRASDAVGGSPGVDDASGITGGRQVAGDGNQDGVLDISDALWLLLRLFGGGAAPLPCGGTSLDEGANRTLLDLDSSQAVEVSDAIFILNFLFRRGPAPALGTSCVRLEGCPEACTR